MMTKVKKRIGAGHVKSIRTHHDGLNQDHPGLVRRRSMPGSSRRSLRHTHSETSPPRPGVTDIGVPAKIACAIAGVVILGVTAYRAAIHATTNTATPRPRG